MTDIIQYDWQNVIGKMLLWGAIILLVYFPVWLAIPYIVKNKKRAIQRQELWKLIHLLAWIFYFTWFMFLFAAIRSWFTVINGLILTGILFLLYRYWLSELVAGLLFRNRNNIDRGDIIHFGSIKGRIVGMPGRSVEVETQEGFTVYIPYSKLQSGIFFKSESKLLSSGFTFDLVINSKEEFPELASRVRSILVTLPWISLKKEPVISLKEKQGDSFNLTVSVAVLDRTFTEKLEQYIRNSFRNSQQGGH